ncbi:MAG: phosphate ABC transporter permease [Acidobacteria bacterium RIFCSPLOWO2_02_FULL_59_13]|nr:MAG: phosphate ABC transporter permease [Acidobacteria bacterium RIFCSPLOWO2_02_FULL_59_13]OGA68044.1 MAG: phosphate ABC transporter permease [Betaproteobacteria bacterium RIFCSPLOWO2_12_FULL_65_14]
MSALREDVVVIEAGHSDRHYWLDLLAYRELLYFLARRDVAVRYKQAFLGIAWAVIRPLFTMVIFTFIFGKLAKLPADGAPYSLLVFTGMVPWFLFAVALADTSSSLVTNANLLTKVYFPRLLVPMSAVATALVDLIIGMVLLLLYMAWLGYPPTFRALALPVFILLALSAALGLGLWFAALNVKYRDFQFVVPFVLQIGLYASPIGFNSTLIPEAWRLIYSLNPMVSVIDGFRWAFLGEPFRVRADGLMVSVATTVVVLLGGLQYFRRTERSLADVI